MFCNPPNDVKIVFSHILRYQNDGKETQTKAPEEKMQNGQRQEHQRFEPINPVIAVKPTKSIRDVLMKLPEALCIEPINSLLY